MQPKNSISELIRWNSPSNSTENRSIVSNDAIKLRIAINLCDFISEWRNNAILCFVSSVEAKKKKNFGSTERKPIMRGPVISFNPRNKRRLPSRASFLRSGQVPGLCAQVEQKHFYPTAEFLRRRRSRVKDIQRERGGGREGERERKLRQKIDWKIMCCEILDWKQILEHCIGEIELYWNLYLNDEEDHFHIFK